MSVNVEIKARIRDFAGLMRRAAALSDTPVEVIDQEDVFFLTANGRLKLRILRPDFGQLVYYEREDQKEPKPSEYFIIPTTDPSTLRQMLSASLGVRGVVRKRRWLYWVDDTRIHLDQVQDLGSFLELEVVLKSGVTTRDGVRSAQRLMGQLGIDTADLVQGAYIDLLEAEWEKRPQ